MRILAGYSKSKRALCDDSAFLQTIMDCGAATAGFQTESVSRTADPNTGANMLDDRAHGDKHADSSEDRIHIKPVRSEFPVLQKL